MIPVLMIVDATVAFFIVERVFPGRDLPEVPGWYARAAFLNLCQVGMDLVAGPAWNRWLQSWSLFHISKGQFDQHLHQLEPLLLCSNIGQLL